MNKNIYLIAVALLGFVSSCMTSEKKALLVVDNFLKQTNDEISGNLDTTKITEPLYNLIKKDGGFASKDGWTLSVNQRNDTLIIIESVGKTHNGFGQPMKIKQKFALKEIEKEWIIYDTYNVIRLFLGMNIVDRDWHFFWDMEKKEILEHLRKNLKLEIVKRGKKTYFGNGYEGKLRLLNNSKYDIRSVKILIEHFDSKGKSVNTDDEYISDIIRQDGYREFDWRTSDCSKCVKQKFRIKFQREF
jgi:hypothetical protein